MKYLLAIGFLAASTSAQLHWPAGMSEPQQVAYLLAAESQKCPAAVRMRWHFWLQKCEDLDELSKRLSGEAFTWTLDGTGVESEPCVVTLDAEVASDKQDIAKVNAMVDWYTQATYNDKTAICN